MIWVYFYVLHKGEQPARYVSKYDHDQCRENKGEIQSAAAAGALQNLAEGCLRHN